MFLVFHFSLLWNIQDLILDTILETNCTKTNSLDVTLHKTSFTQVYMPTFRFNYLTSPVAAHGTVLVFELLLILSYDFSEWRYLWSKFVLSPEYCSVSDDNIWKEEASISLEFILLNLLWKKKYKIKCLSWINETKALKEPGNCTFIVNNYCRVFNQ